MKLLKIVTPLILLITSSFILQQSFTQESSKSTSLHDQEFRGVWIASVDNLHWPSKRGLSSEQQKQELCTLLDFVKNLHLNTVIFQIRPACDALYQSHLEPWSEVLTGTMGKAPEPFYDPLEYIIKECHKRNLKLHAWINPFRAHATYHVKRGGISSNHVAHKYPQYVIPYGKKLLILDPGEPEAREHVLKVIADIVSRYNIDGFHIDDYFYPYPEPGTLFNDSKSYKKYGRGKPLKEWRRANINNFVERMYHLIKQIKPSVKVGISPFGIWRPDHPRGTKAGIDAYEDLCADSKKWLERGWCDYFIPQLYWKINGKGQNYTSLLGWWKSNNKKHRALIAGLYAFFPPQEIIDQILFARALGGIEGNCLYSINPLMKNEELQKTLLKECY